MKRSVETERAQKHSVKRFRPNVDIILKPPEIPRGPDITLSFEELIAIGHCVDLVWNIYTPKVYIGRDAVGIIFQHLFSTATPCPGHNFPWNTIKCCRSAWLQDWYNVQLVCREWRDLAKDIVDPSFCNNWPIVQAARKNSVESVRSLLRSGRVDPHVENNWAIRNAINMGNLEMLKLLCQHGGADNFVPSVEELSGCACLNRVDVFREIHSQFKVDWSMNDNQILKVAASSGAEELVLMLLENHQVVQRGGLTTAFLSSLDGNHLELSCLLSSFEEFDAQGSSFLGLLAAIKNGNAEAVSLILCDDRIDVSTTLSSQPHGHFQLLRAAIVSRHEHTISLLLDQTSIDFLTNDAINHAFVLAAELGEMQALMVLLNDPRVDPTFSNNEAYKRAMSHGFSYIGDFLVDRHEGVAVLATVAQVTREEEEREQREEERQRGEGGL
ncbi:putative ankyrin repeat-containing protein [Planoprotostelium fungivorum]|uniref:Putative ankyrin repeat-containing protein n=1 Tax=Planoprotostelium fungivorum TaxID=1890364 RepID=A0A2P6N7P9_9EUKA|nr:putative ankyrin repeat-containing protein [Planoprotostelium fungivorum]